MNDDLERWVRDHIEELKFVSEYGRTETLRAQAQALLRVGNEGEKEKQASNKAGGKSDE